MTHDEKQEFLARQICHKPTSVPLKECHDGWGRRNALCNDQLRCRIREKSAEQIDYVLSSTRENLFLKACPGSGKTEAVGLKAAYTVQNWQCLPGGVAVLTFTNNAATEISVRVNQLAGVEATGYPHFIGTFDSWLHGYIANPFAHLKTGYEGQHGDRSIRVIDEKDDSPWLNTYKLRTPFLYAGGIPVPLYANKIRYDYRACKWEIKVPASETSNSVTDDEYYDSGPFTEFRKDKPWLTLEFMRDEFRQKKELFNRAGFATYQDAENLCFEVLREDPALCRMLARRFPFIIVDECQDLSWIQLQILDKLRERGTTLHFVGDLNQGIYEFRGVDPQTVASFTSDRRFAVLRLSANYRSNQSIVDLCKRIVKNDDPEESKCQQKCSEPCSCVTYEEGRMHLLPAWFIKYLEGANLEKEESAVVARNWNNVSRLRPSVNSSVKGPQMALAAAIQLWKSGCEQSLGDALRFIGRLVSDKYFSEYSSDARCYYCPECVDSRLRWRLFLMRILKASSSEGSEVSNLNQTWEKWAAVVRRDFDRIIRDCFSTLEDNFEDPPRLGNMNGFRALPGKGKTGVSLTMPSFPLENNESDLRITTIHSVKGKTLDAILVVSAPRRQGTSDGHWSHWLENPNSEAARLAYVASSRPRHLLAWAVPQSVSKQDLAKITQLGFHIVKM